MADYGFPSEALSGFAAAVDGENSSSQQYEESSTGYQHAPSPQRSATDGSPRPEDYERVLSPRAESSVSTPSHVSAPSSPLSAHADDSGEEFNADSPNVPGSPEANNSRDQPENYNPTSPLQDFPSSSRSPQQTEGSAPQSPRYREDDGDEKSDVEAVKTGSDDDEDARKKRSAAESGGEDDEGDEEMSRKRRRIVNSDDSDNEESGSKKNLLDSDDSDDEMDEEQRKKKLGNLMVNIFGEDVDEDADASRDADGDQDDEEGDREREQAVQDEEGYEDDYGDRNKEDRDNAGFEWDFDVMLREKKAERKKKRRKRDTGIDIINDDDGIIAHMVSAMKNAAKDDRHSNTERKPALKKRKMLGDVKMMLLRMDMLEAMIDGGMMSAVSEWLAPLPDKSLPALEIRTELLKILQGFGRLDQGVLKQSGLGRAVMLLYKHPRETKENKAMAAHIIREWSRPIFQLDTDFRSVSREERVQRDLDHMSTAKKRKMNGEAGPSDQQATPKEPEKTINRARVPRPSTKDYVVRPKSNVEGEFKGERKGRGFARLDKAQRDFMERTKKMKVKRAVGVSLEGRNMAL
ncbi:IWS1 protein [Necator americanus]|uniref:IWS1 protein n=1 Tax=Necator americanus TaxID=51031 RepID=W2TGH6_NECAM|nr:IWS1 protein [Necator americanus]ETN80704.1 IWS1 protein [Necator americanus]